MIYRTFLRIFKENILLLNVDFYSRMINEERPSVRCYPHFPVFRHKFAILRIRKSEIRVTFSRGRSGGRFWVPGPFPHCTVRIVIDVIRSPGSRVLALLPSWWEIVWWWLNFLSSLDFFWSRKKYSVIKSRRKTEKYGSLLHCTLDITYLITQFQKLVSLEIYQNIIFSGFS